MAPRGVADAPDASRLQVRVVPALGEGPKQRHRSTDLTAKSGIFRRQRRVIIRASCAESDVSDRWLVLTEIPILTVSPAGPLPADSRLKLAFERKGLNLLKKAFEMLIHSCSLMRAVLLRWSSAGSANA